ncbi:MAG: SMC family ATPase [Pyrinomonadaceae bacterium]|nr:SMC family ATPase [Acidobacteriota bacterium]MBP7375792.1 SMC family ATPase [Pyrinomonadaceae bacterium]
MHISRIELENIKSHAAATFEFTRGTTAITGENGAGKTTLIEAVAWTLFDLLEYKKEDFIKRGEKKGVARVTFESGLDEREYIVYRDTGAGYHVTDPRLNTRIADKKEEVFRFLWQHLGLEPGTDLKSLFRQAIGVPQGTFTAIFLEGATERKVAFDRLLKVEEYRQAAEKLRETTRFLDVSIAGVRENLARAEGELSRAELVDEEFKSYQGQTEKLAGEVENLATEIEHRRVYVANLNEIEKVENALEKLRADQKDLQEKLQSLENAHREIAELKPKAAEQETLEAEITRLREEIAVAKAVENQVMGLDDRVARLRVSYKSNLDQLKEAESKAAGAVDIMTFEKRDGELIEQIAALKAGLERDRKFQSEIQNGLCPILSQKCLNLKPGQTLEDFVSSQFTDLTAQIETAEASRAKVAADLRSARESERFAAALVGLRRREAELKAEGTHLNNERADLEKQIAGLDALEKELSALDAKLRALGDPRSRTRILDNEIARESELRGNVTKIESNLERLVNDRRILFEQIDGHDSESDAAIYDRQRHAAERVALHESEKRHAEVRATFEATKRREEQLAAELKRFAEIRKSMQGEFQEKERLETVAETTAFIRDTLKEAAPRVARNYVYHVSLEANLMYREITGNAERTLKWGEDYAIILEEDGYERPFQSLSGGEQMAAALSVRLALLKQLTDIRIAFFDEPTTNMDAERRENLAMQISRITHFDQLFVISHDDTFDSYVDNVLTLG